MARREKDLIDNPHFTGQPSVYENNHKNDSDLKSALIEYLERIEFDPELENLYPESREREDCSDQQHLQDKNLSWPYAVQECGVCVDERRRYPACNENNDCCLSGALLTNYNKGKRENEIAPFRTYDVMMGVQDCHSKCDNSQIKNDGQNESLTFISDLGFGQNRRNRKNIMMRDKEGCEAKTVITENSKSLSQSEYAGRRYRICQTTDRSLKKPSRSRVDINMVSVSKREAKPSRGLIKMAGCDLRSEKQTADVLKDGMQRQGTGGNYQCDDRQGLVRDENRIMNECTHPSSSSNLRKCDRNDMPVAAKVKNDPGIDRQTKGNMRRFTRCARQCEINTVNPFRQLRQNDDDASMMPVRPAMSFVRERELEENWNSAGEGELRCDVECLPQTHLSVVNGVKPIDNRLTANDSRDIYDSEKSLYSAHLEELDDSTVMKVGHSRALSNSERKEGVKLTESSRMDKQKDTDSPKINSFDSSPATKHELIGNAVIKSTNSQFANVNGFDNDDKGHLSVRTKPGSETRPEPIVIPIQSNDEEDGNVFESKNKWMIEIVDNESNSDNISFIPTVDTPRIRLSDEAHCCEPSFKKGGNPAEDKRRKTIECLGDHNPVLENTSPARKSIEKGLSQKCIVHGDLEEKVNDNLSTGKMWRKSALGRDTVKQYSTSAEKSKLIYQGQGVQLRVNIKKPIESISNAPKDEQVGAGEKGSQPSKIVSTGKPVSLKSSLKSIKTEGKLEIESRTNGKQAVDGDYYQKSKETDIDLDQLDSDLVDILNYEPPKLSVPITGKGHVEFGLYQPIEDNSLKMENARLSKLLLEVEQARSTTVKALLSANSVLHKVSDANTELEGALKTLSTDKKFLQLELEEYKEKLKHSNSEKDVFSAADATEFESSMKVIISSWKKEKQELLSALAKSSLRVKRVEADADGLRVAFQRVKDQLENSNETFNKLLEHNLQASVIVEQEMRGLKEEKIMLTERIAQSSGDQEKIKELKDEIAELQACLESSNDEKEELYRKIAHLEKKNKQLSVECDDLQEQLDHSQEIVDKLAEKEEDLKERLEKETSEKEYLQDCLEETGQILFHLRNNEKKLLDEKGELEEDLEEEMQVNESLQQSLKSTMKEHQDLVSRLQDMTNIHLTVKQSLDQASKKEKSYQQQISGLNRTNNILQYSLEKEKEEKIELREMYENSECQWKIFKHDRMLEVMDLNKKLDELTESDVDLKSQNERFLSENENLRVSLEHEEEENEDLRKRLVRLEEWKETNESDLDRIRQERDGVQSEADDLRKRVEDLSRGLQKEKTRYDALMCTLEDTEESLDKSLKDLSKSSSEVSKLDKELQEFKEHMKEKGRKVRELEIRLGDEIGEKDRIINKSKNLENELSKSRKFEEKQREEIETYQMQVKRIEREKMCLRKSLDESKQDFDTHRERCVENFQKLREELVGVQNKLVEKDREAMKQKENWQDAMDNTAADLKLLRDFLGGDLNYKSVVQGNYLLREVLDRDSGADIELLRRAYQKAESEMMRDVSDLEGMLKVSKEQKNTVAVVQSPMSKIKLSEIKKLRDEMYELNSNLLVVRNQISSIFDEVLVLKNGEKHGDLDNKAIQEKSDAILKKLKELDLAVLKLESDHEYVIEKNNGIINKGIANVSRERSMEELDSSSESAYEGEESEATRKEIINSKLIAENEKLKKDIEFLEKKCQTAANTGIDSDDLTDGKRSHSTQKSTVVDDTPPVRPSSSQKYVPPTSMRYPPRYKRALPKHEKESATVHHNDYQSSDGGHNDRILDQKTKATTSENQKKPSYFTAEMSLFHHDESLAADILRQKLKSKHYFRESKNDSDSIRKSGSAKSEVTPRIHRSGSVEDDEENDEDSDLSTGELRRSKTLPRRFKTRTKLV